MPLPFEKYLSLCFHTCDNGSKSLSPLPATDLRLLSNHSNNDGSVYRFVDVHLETCCTNNTFNHGEKNKWLLLPVKLPRRYCTIEGCIVESEQKIFAHKLSTACLMRWQWRIKLTVAPYCPQMLPKTDIRWCEASRSTNHNRGQQWGSAPVMCSFLTSGWDWSDNEIITAVTNVLKIPIVLNTKNPNWQGTLERISELKGSLLFSEHFNNDVTLL